MPKSADRKYKKGILIALVVTNLVWAASFVAFVTWLALKSAQDTPVCTTKQCLEQSLLLMNSVDESTHPCDDFYQHVCGSWIQRAELASGEGMTSPITQLEKEIKRSLSSALAKWDIQSNSAIDKAATLFKHCIDMDRLQEFPYLSLTNALMSACNAPLFNSRWREESFNVAEFLATSMIIGQSFLALEVTEDLSNSTIYRLALTIPESYYERQIYFMSQNYYDYRSFLTATVKAFLNTYKEQPATLIEEHVTEILSLEQKILDHMVGNATETGDDGGPPKPIKFSALDPFYQDIIGRLFRKLGTDNKVDPEEEIILSADAETIMKLKDLILATPARILANYEAWSLLRGPLFEALPKNLRSLQERILLQISDQYGTDRRYHCLSLVQKYYEYALGRLYVNDRMNNSYKLEAIEMTRVIAKAFRRISLENNDWLDEETRAAALEKLNTLRFEIAYPEFILNSTALDAHYKHMPDAEPLFGNFASIVMQSLMAKARLRFERFARRTVDKQEWEMGPYEVNAYYSLSSNKVAIPAGHLTLPLFHPLLPQSFNYGALGWTIGHEIAHAFDTKGRLFDKNGNLRNWWTNESMEIFENKTTCISTAAANFCHKTVANETRCINSKLTIDEDVSDLAGLRAAFYGYEEWRTASKKPDEKLSGLMKLSNEQLFFMAAGLPWCEIVNTTASEMSLLTDNHSPVKFRLNNAVKNMPEFSQAFKCPVGSAMNGGNSRCKVCKARPVKLWDELDAFYHQNVTNAQQRNL